ncbi:MAG: hypothetical protein O3B72_08175 [Proteobacteria bacterium]|nr:hypothetical protein [Pseudomonadota bacterium]
MKVFVPMSDATLGMNGEVHQQLIPFDPAFLEEARPREGHKPANWVAECNYEQARQRLFAVQN